MNVVYLPVRVTDGEIPPERVLQKAIDADLQHVVILAMTKDNRFYCASSTDAREAMLFLERARIEILKSLGAL